MALTFDGFLATLQKDTLAIAIGYGIGVALARALEPEAVALAQDAFSHNPSKALEPDAAAGIVAEHLDQESWGVAEAAQGGVNHERFKLLLEDALNAPDVGTLLTLWRRGLIADDRLLHGLRKHRLEIEWDGAIQGLKHVPLSPQEIAVAVQRGLLPVQDLLPVGPPTTAGKVPPMPSVDLDAYTEAAKHGFARPELQVLTRIVGLPPAPGELLQMVNRGIIDETDFYRGVAEGNTRNEWASFLLQLRHPVLSENVYARLHLKGWIDEAAMHAGGALRGYTAAQMDQIFLSEGRPMAPVQMFNAYARKAPGPYGGVFSEADFRKGIAQSDIRPEYADPLWAIRHAYPSAFFIRFAVQHGAAPLPRVRQILEFQRYEAQDIDWLMAAFGAAGSSGAKQLTLAELRDEFEGGFITEPEYRTALGTLGYVGQAQDLEIELGAARKLKAERGRVVDAIRDEFLYHEITDAEAITRLAEVQVLGTAANQFVRIWSIERRQTLRRLSGAEIAKAYKKGVLDLATANQRLLDLDYSPRDAAIRLAEEVA